MENNCNMGNKHLLRRDDPRFYYTTDELFDIIHKYEDAEMKDFVKDGREDGVIRIWVNLNMKLLKDEQIDLIKAEYEMNGWRKVCIERHEERGQETLYICLYL